MTSEPLRWPDDQWRSENEVPHKHINHNGRRRGTCQFLHCGGKPKSGARFIPDSSAGSVTHGNFITQLQGSERAPLHQSVKGSHWSSAYRQCLRAPRDYLPPWQKLKGFSFVKKISALKEQAKVWHGSFETQIWREPNGWQREDTRICFRNTQDNT